MSLILTFSAMTGMSAPDCAGRTLTMTDYSHLIERLEKAEGHPDEMRHLFKQILKALDIAPSDAARIHAFCKVGAFLDAAMSLVEAKLPGCAVEMETVNGWTWWRINSLHEGKSQGFMSPNGLLLALLRALQEQEHG
ncbi:hypothetical protein [Microvirga alba]|uniref:Uncharacterized protein n=1 Tax=Microvirga alba TaxID=2791025 RepID=A0A931BQ29_9HYPH|nr:hypothetical protein [Microvirga alba]MBF9233968.1 hypothetical protein [Microvirga alba]